MARRSLSRRKFLATAGTLAALGSGAGVYARYVESGWLRRVDLVVPLPRLGGPVRAVHLSDLHASRQVPFSLVERAVTMALEAEPDVVFITGDFITRSTPEPDRYARILRPLSEATPVYACLGNHDGGAWAGRHGGYRDTASVRALLEAAAIDGLCDEHRTLEVRGQHVDVVGVGDIWAGEVRARQAFPQGDPGNDRPTLLLSHNPDSKKDFADLAWDLMLSGHTHGGQFAAPLVGTPFAPVRDHGYVRGLNPWRDRWVHTSPGVGNVLGMRLNCRPEVNVLNLVPDPAGHGLSLWKV